MHAHLQLSIVEEEYVLDDAQCCQNSIGLLVYEGIDEEDEDDAVSDDETQKDIYFVVRTIHNIEVTVLGILMAFADELALIVVVRNEGINNGKHCEEQVNL